MSLSNFVDSFASRRLTVTVFAPDPYPDLEAVFDQPNVTVRWNRIPDTGTDGFVAVEDESGFRGAIPITAIKELLEPTSIPDPGSKAVRTSQLGEFFALVREATFSSFDRRTLLLTAREFEDRAWRSTGGALHAGFQRQEAFESQQRVYSELASHRGLDVHIYADPDWDLPAIPDVRIHHEGGPDLGDVWFVVFDGGQLPADACGLLAVEISDGEYYGLWTYDPETVAEIIEILETEYA